MIITCVKVTRHVQDNRRHVIYKMWDSRGGPHGSKRWPQRVREVAPTTYIMWHFAPCGT